MNRAEPLPICLNGRMEYEQWHESVLAFELTVLQASGAIYYWTESAGYDEDGNEKLLHLVYPKMDIEDFLRMVLSSE